MTNMGEMHQTLPVTRFCGPNKYSRQGFLYLFVKNVYSITLSMSRKSRTDDIAGACACVHACVCAYTCVDVFLCVNRVANLLRNVE